MNSDSLNTERNISEHVPDSQPRTSRYEAGYEGDAEVESQPKWYLLQVDLVWSGIVLAAGCYPLVIGGFVMVYSVLTYGFHGLRLEAFGMVIIFLIISFIVGSIYGILMSIPAWFSTELLRWGLRGIISDRGMSGIYGGMTGFLCTSGGGLFVEDMVSTGGILELLPLLLMLVLAVAMGHVGAILAGYRKRNDGFHFFEPMFSFKKRITIGYLMKLTLIVAVLAAISKSAGSAGFYIGISWLVYLLVQTLLLIGDHRLTAWLSHR